MLVGVDAASLGVTTYRVAHLNDPRSSPSSSVLSSSSRLDRFSPWLLSASKSPPLQVEGDTVGVESPALVAVPASGEPPTPWNAGRGAAAPTNDGGVVFVPAAERLSPREALDEEADEVAAPPGGAGAAAARRQPSSSDV